MTVALYTGGWDRYNDGCGPDLFLKNYRQETDGWHAVDVKLAAGSAYQSGSHSFPTTIIIREGTGVLQTKTGCFTEYAPDFFVSIGENVTHGFSSVHTDTVFTKRWVSPAGRCLCLDKDIDFFAFGTCVVCGGFDLEKAPPMYFSQFETRH